MTTDITGGSRSGTPSDNTTLVAVLAELDADGYTASFGARDGGRLDCSSCHQQSPADQFDVESFRRLEGASDPDAQVLLVAARCPACGAMGTAVFGYGPEQSSVDAEVITHLDITDID